MNIYEKLQKITEEMEVVEKELNVQVNKTSSYKAVSERNILDNVKPLENKYKVFSYPLKREVIDRDTLVKETEYNGTITRTNTIFMRIETTYRFVNVEKPDEFIDITTYGDGLDTGDKAPGKAMTYADKYALMKAYKISTGDDPDKEASPEQGYKKTNNILLATDKQKEIIKKIYTSEEIKEYLNDVVEKKKLSELTIQEASEFIKERNGE